MTRVILAAALLLASPTAVHIAARDRALERCMVYLPDMPEGKLKRWCLKQSERMP